MTARRYVRTFAEIGNDDVALVGGKNASLGEMYQQLAGAGVRVPDGFAVTAEGYRHTLDVAGAWPRLREIFDALHHDDVADLELRAAEARDIVHDAGLPDDLAAQVIAGHRALMAEYGPDMAVAVRSSATAEDLPDASFAGQHESYLNVRGEADLLEAVRLCFASVFTARGVHYRHRHGFDQLKVSLSVGVMKMVRSDLASSGVAFTLDTESGFRDVVFINGSYGLGENVVKGSVDPDEFYVHKPTFEDGHRAVLRRRLGGKAITMVLRDDDGDPTHDVATPEAARERFCLTDEEVLDLTGTALTIERHYGRPMDIEWAKDGVDGAMYIVQARPETVAARVDTDTLTRFIVQSHGDELSQGRAVGDRIAHGRARVITHLDQLKDFQPGEVLISEMTTPDWEPVMKMAAAVVTDHGGRTCHAAIIAREQGLPAVVGTGDGTTRIPDGEMVTVSCAEGDAGHVYAGVSMYRREEVAVGNLARPRTQMMLNLGDPGLAFKTSFLPNDGVGLARMEFVINESVRVHPMAALHPEAVTDDGERAAIETLLRGHPDGASYVVERLSEGIGTIAAAFHPKPVVVRMSDFKSNEYAALLGGSSFEPVESNPMIGFRGASRYVHPAYAEGFALECQAMRRVRDEMGLTNVVLMIPFVRRLAEADDVLAEMAKHGLERGANGLRIFAMCEIPNNVILVDEFARRFDGFSIGSNDLTQLTLGVDRDSELVAFDYDERDPGVKRMIELAVEGCRRNGIHSGLCGQAPSDYPDMAQFLVHLGIDSMSLNPDSIVRTTMAVLEAEKRRGAVPA